MDSLTTALKQHFGYDQFRPNQRAIVERVLEGKDTVVLMPTGGGKSICYQLPTLLQDGLTVVVSPLIALMQDQVQGLRAAGIEAAFLNSTLTPEQSEAIKNRLNQVELQLLYVSPEKIAAPGFLDYLATLEIGLFAIDEAHCVSSWGHHFRPEYKELHVLKSRFPQVPVIALTATADRSVRSDIGELLGLEEAQTFISSFDRPNLSLAVLPGQKKFEQLSPLLERHRGECGIIYCGTRNKTEQLAKKLSEAGHNAAFYHAGVKSEERARIQDAFITGEIDLICATIAFGMGIDKGDVRFVVHWNLPGNLESFYQEIGRAGRDGEPSETVLFYSYADVQRQLQFIDEIDDPHFRKIQTAKLNRMKAYAEAQVCRRNILLSYFSETPEGECGNCDVCENPPSYFDGTELTQMALSAVARAKERLGLPALIDVLKGTHSPVITANGWHQLRTFGVGRETSAFAWNQYLQQLLQQGLLDLDYKDHYTLKLTTLSNKVLYENQPVRLVSFETIKERQEAQKAKAKQARTRKQPAGNVDPTLYDKLRECRKTIADEIGKPAYIVFSNATLEDMAARKPTTMEEFKQVSGVGDYKAEAYGERFLEVVRENA